MTVMRASTSSAQSVGILKDLVRVIVKVEGNHIVGRTVNQPQAPVGRLDCSPHSESNINSHDVDRWFNEAYGNISTYDEHVMFDPSTANSAGNVDDDDFLASLQEGEFCVHSLRDTMQLTKQYSLLEKY